MPTRKIVPEAGPLDLSRTLGPMMRGPSDPTSRVVGGEVWRSARTPDGPVTLHLRSEPSGSVRVEAWGWGADWALERAPDLIGAHDAAEDFVPLHPVVAEARRRFPGLRVPRNRDITRTLIAAILEQKVTAIEAMRAWKGCVRLSPEPAPGPMGLLLPPNPTTIAQTPYFALHPAGIARRSAELLRAVCASADALELLADVPAPAARSHLEAIPGVGPWTSAQIALLCLGDADAVSVGDYHMPHTVCWALAREPRGTDGRMLELLQPYSGHRGRVQMLLKVAGIQAPRFGPKTQPADIRGL
jgi:3-methyladenine DNA glycosylase/8-oxoguanine DNA glycosylase